MIDLSKAEIADLAELQEICSGVEAELVIIGAVAYKTFFPNEERETGDVDSAIAVDLDDFEKICGFLEARQWKQDANKEQRWRSARGTIVDLVPAGKKLREAKQITWPKSKFRMSLVGFEHVFSEAQVFLLSEDLSVRIIPPHVLMLLKIVAFMESSERRKKDLPDIRGLLSRYEAKSDRLFDEVVFDAELTDFSLANAFLLGLDLHELCDEDEVSVVRKFVSYVRDEAQSAWMPFVLAAPRSVERNEETARSQLDAFSLGFEKVQEI